MAATANTISVNTSEASLKTLFSKIQKVQYYPTGEITKSLLTTGLETIALPVLEDSVSLNTGDADVTEVNILDGSVWTSKAKRGDSSISMQVASIDDTVNGYFMSKKNDFNVSGIKVDGTNTFSGTGYTLDVKKATGGLILLDDTGTTAIILPSVEMYGSLVVADGDNPAYFNVKITPSVSSADGVAIMIFKKTA